MVLMFMLATAFNALGWCAIAGNIYFAVKGREKQQHHCIGIMFAYAISYAIIVLKLKGWF